MSPEGILENSYGPKTDVWAFGIMVYELYHNKTPFCLCVTEEDLKASVMRPLQWSQLNPSIPNEAKELIMACLQVNEERRPYMQELSRYSFIQQALRNR